MSNGETSNAILAFVKKRPGELAAATMSVIAVGAVVAALTVTNGHGGDVASPIDTVAVPETAGATTSASSSDVVNLHMLAQPLASLPAERVGSTQKTALEDALRQVKDALSATSTEPDALQTSYTALQNAVGGMATSTLSLGREHRLQVTLAAADILTAYDAALIELADAGDDRERTSGISALVRQATAAQSSHSAAVDSQQDDDTTLPEQPVDNSGDDTATQAPQPSTPVPPAFTGQPVPDGSGGAATTTPGETTPPTQPPIPEPTDEPTDPQPTGEPTPSEGSDSDSGT